MDDLNAEAARLRHLRDPTSAQRMRLIAIQVTELPKARQLVQRLREAEKSRRYF